MQTDRSSDSQRQRDHFEIEEQEMTGRARGRREDDLVGRESHQDSGKASASQSYHGLQSRTCMRGVEECPRIRVLALANRQYLGALRLQRVKPMFGMFPRDGLMAY